MSVRSLMMGGAKGGGDPSFSDVALLLHGDGTNGGSNSVTDISVNNYTITTVGTVSISSLTPFSTGFSASFPGASSYLTAPCNFNPAGTWTIEAWCYFTNGSNSDVIVNGLASDRLYVQWVGTTFYVGDAIINNIVVANSKPLNTWFHLAVVKNGSTYTAYLNGTSIGSSTSALNSTTLTTWQIGGRTSQGMYAQGYISNLRITTTAVYTSNFTPSTTPLTAISGTTLLLKADSSIVDSSLNKFPISTFGNAQISTGIKKFGTGSLYFDGNGDYLSVTTNSSYTIGTSNFTIECWIYINATNYGVIYDGRPTSTNGAYPCIYLNNNVITYFVNNADVIVGSTLSNLTWHHIAVCRSGTSTRLFVNGTQSGSTYSDSNSYLNTNVRPNIGTSGWNPGTVYFNGYIDELRVSKIARYTANFGLPTGPFPDIAPYDPDPNPSTGDTSLVKLLLRCDGTGGSQTFTDSSVNARGVTAGGNAQISNTIKKYGTGSALFDGIGDYLVSSASVDFRLTANFTVECWVYPTTRTQLYPTVFCIANGGVFDSTGAIYLYFDHDSNRNKYIVGVNATWGYFGTITPGLNTWNHVAVVRNGNIVSLYVNGVLDGTFSLTSTVYTADPACYVGVEAASKTNFTEFAGFIDDFRVVKGKAVYTANFTPPTTTLSSGA